MRRIYYIYIKEGEGYMDYRRYSTMPSLLEALIEFGDKVVGYNVLKPVYIPPSYPTSNWTMLWEKI